MTEQITHKGHSGLQLSMTIIFCKSQIIGENMKCRSAEDGLSPVSSDAYGSRYESIFVLTTNVWFRWINRTANLNFTITMMISTARITWIRPEPNGNGRMMKTAIA
ncbi:MAG: hypothetical protein R2941_02075 [Desulfobacterales bacterium]